MAKTPARLHNFYPKGLIPHNIESNEGIAKVVRMELEEMGLLPGGYLSKYTKPGRR